MTFFGDVYMPPEVVEHIIKHLDPKSFILSRRICRSWMEIVDRLDKDKRVWNNFAKNFFDWRIQSVVHKSKMSQNLVFRNYCLWKQLPTAKTTIDILDGVESLPVRCISTTSDGKLCVTLKEEILVYDIFTLTPEFRIQGRYLKYNQNERMIAVHLTNNSLQLTPIPPTAELIPEHIFIDDVDFFRIEDNTCFYVTMDRRLCKCITKNFYSFEQPEFMARWFSSDQITHMHLYNNEIFLLTCSGRLLTYKNNRLITVDDFDCPRFEHTDIVQLFAGKSIVYATHCDFFASVEGNVNENNFENEKKITCLLLHANMLFIGTHWGAVNFYYLEEIEDLLTLDLERPMYHYLLRNEDSGPILSLDVYENIGSHHLFIHTKKNVCSIKFTHSLPRED